MKNLFRSIFFKKRRSKTTPQAYEGLSRKDAFSKVYKDGIWSGTLPDDSTFHSGEGSRDATVIAPYVLAVTGHLTDLGPDVTVADIGCGDFNVGRQIAPSAGRYCAFDIVPELIDHLKETEATDRLTFHVLDLAEDPLPKADVILVRQVLQHLSNADIATFAAKVPAICKNLIVTEHLPSSPDFKPNMEHQSGPGIRLGINSGVVLSAPPFNLAAQNERVLCEIQAFGGRIQTTLYEF